MDFTEPTNESDDHHGGQERAFGEADDRLSDPRKLALALESGVTVIIAHLAASGQLDRTENFYHALSMLDRYPNLYADISALTQVNRRGYLFDALDRALTARMVYGSDWPLQFFPLVSPWYQLPRADASALRQVAAIDNTWDRDVALKRAMGVPESVFQRARTLLPVEGR